MTTTHTFIGRAAAMLLASALGAPLSGCGGGGGSAPAAPVVTPTTPAYQLAANTTVLTPGVTVGAATWPEGSTASGGNGAPVAGVNCLVTEDYHIHAHLTILRDGNALAIPAHIGLQGCAYELHTHDQSGVIHVETSAARKFTLGQLFAVWGQPLSRSNVAGISGLPVTVLFNDNDTVLEWTGDIGALELTSHRSITIELGTVQHTVPAYRWDSSL
ncbi:hypothetical protein H3H36_17940 [Duganella sp. FT3S]|uniref:Uncharacterized protein n=1 Tax=Rugamonas fusca TaxID=2758568 RepID=A0A7W2EK13_9BURK|nr:hypothetical protein [Rugamonas fusca]MBA5607242.1 hypothetical protein [Rugamonas fusca]